MINGFEDFTDEVSQEEIKAATFLVSHLKKKIGRKKAVTNARITQFLDANGFGKLNSARVRKIINYIRVNNLVKNLIANSRGYFIAAELYEVVDFLESLKRRENSIKKVRSSYDTDIRLF